MLPDSDSDEVRMEVLKRVFAFISTGSKRYAGYVADFEFQLGKNATGTYRRSYS